MDELAFLIRDLRKFWSPEGLAYRKAHKLKLSVLFVEPRPLPPTLLRKMRMAFETYGALTGPGIKRTGKKP